MKHDGPGEVLASVLRGLPGVAQAFAANPLNIPERLDFHVRFDLERSDAGWDALLHISDAVNCAVLVEDGEIPLFDFCLIVDPYYDVLRFAITGEDDPSIAAELVALTFEAVQAEDSWPLTARGSGATPARIARAEALIARAEAPREEDSS